MSGNLKHFTDSHGVIARSGRSSICPWWTLSTLGLLLMAVTITHAQTHHYQVIYSGQELGTLSVDQQGLLPERHIMIKSTVQVKFLLNLNIEVRIETRFKDGLLSEARAERNSNNDKVPDELTVTTLEPDKTYLVTSKGQTSRLNTHTISYSVADMYFQEPRRITRAYSETYGIFFAIRPLGDGEYKLTRQDGKANIYRYKNGLLIEVQVASPVGKTFFRLSGE